MTFDEFNTQRFRYDVDTIYNELKQNVIDIYYECCKTVYPSVTKSNIYDWLEEYYVVAEYIFFNEWDRKSARYYEMMMSYKKAEINLSSPEVMKSQNKAVNLLGGQMEEFGVFVIDKANIENLKAQGYKKVCWKTQDDLKVCDVCFSRRNKIYDIEKVPSKAHWGCRCYLVGVKE